MYNIIIQDDNIMGKEYGAPLFEIFREKRRVHVKGFRNVMNAPVTNFPVLFCNEDGKLKSDKALWEILK